jgi:cell fate regulator YaaT (PSP1 superfamily)
MTRDIKMTIDKGTLYWSRGCVTETGDAGEIISCRAVKNCHKLTVYNWLRDIPADREYDIFEVRFKNTRKGFYRNVNHIDLYEGDIVAVEASPGHDIGIISASGPVAELKFLKSTPNVVDASTVELRKIYRTVRPSDIEKWQEAVSLEYTTMIQSRKMAASLGLNMKIGDVDFQGDKTKAIFYYIADERVDFRELIKIMADTFKIRIEMRQIGARQEAGLIGGIGPCGRELCCAQWMRSFVSVSTNAVRHQDISVNPLKLAGQCSKLKCCLNYELDTYLDALEDFPKVRQIETVTGTIFLQKTDVLKGVMYFATSSSAPLFPISIEEVKKMLEQNNNGEKFTLHIDNNDDVNSEFKSAVGEDSLTRFDKSKKKRKKKKTPAVDNIKPLSQTDVKPSFPADVKPSSQTDVKLSSQTDVKLSSQTDVKPSSQTDVKPSSPADVKPSPAKVKHNNRSNRRKDKKNVNKNNEK